MAGLRDNDHLYTITSHSEYGFSCGIDREGRQLLIGVLEPSVIALFFDHTGAFLFEDQRSMYTNAQSRKEAEPTAMASDLRELETWKKELGLTEGAIRIHKFRWPKDTSKQVEPWEYNGIGIEDLPWHLMECVNDPGIYNKLESNGFAERIHEWIDRGDFVLWWGNDFDMNKDGKVMSS